MDSNQEIDQDELQRKGRRSLRIAVGAGFFLALLWPLGSFFFWIFFGTAAYFGFLAWFYNNRAKPQEPDWRQEPHAVYDTSVASKKVRLNLLIPIVVGLFIFGAIARSIISSSSQEETPIEEIIAEDSEPITAEENNPNDLDVLTNRGNKFYDEGQYDSALFYYNRVLTIDRSNQFAQYDKALVYYAQKDYRRSISILRRCLHEHPEYGEAFWLLGDNYFDRQQLDSAKLCFNSAYEKGLRQGSFLQLMASVYEISDRSKAIGLYKESIQQDSTLTDSYKKLIVLDPSNAIAYQTMLSKWSEGK